MKVARETLTLASEERMEFLDITKQIRDAVQKHPISDGIVLVNSLHTTVAPFVNEDQRAPTRFLKTRLKEGSARDGDSLSAPSVPQRTANTGSTARRMRERAVSRKKRHP